MPATRPSMPTTRPSITPGTRPSTRPGLTPGSRPEIGSGTRPGVIERPTTRPGQRPGNGELPTTRPGVIERPSTRPVERPGSGNRPGIGDRPSQLPGDRPGNGNRPGGGDRPGLPGLGDRPGMGDRPGNRPGLGDRPVTRPSVPDRGDRIDDRLNNRKDRWDNRQDRWQDRRDNWDNWRDRHYGHHHHWHHGCWPGHWYPGARWNYWWDRYPALTAFGVTTWAINRVGWAFGYYNYSNPYASGVTYVDNSVYDYSQPIVMTPDETALDVDPSSTEPVSGPSEDALSSFDLARNAFYDGDYEKALEQTDAALKEMPNDTVIHEFRALVLFALGKYSDSAATLYAVLSVGPGWDWTTLSSLYANVDVYTEQLRKLEEYCRSKPDDMSGRFVLAYHYVTGGHGDAAQPVLEQLINANPQDQVAKQLLLQIDPEAKIPDAPEPVEPPQPSNPVESGALVGDWRATRDGGTFEMDLDENKEFKWTYSANGDSQSVTGVWGVDDDGVLALEMNDEGAMLAQVVVSGSKLDFYMLGDTQGMEPLKFVKK